jgi:hypothetical protein
MKIIESFLDRVQTEKLDSNDIARKSTKVFQKVYKHVVEDCFSKQKREEYTAVQPDINCEDKAQISAYNVLLQRLDKWINRCKDEICKRDVINEKRKIKNQIRYLEQRLLLTKK